ncbi:MAG: holo-ACP synthase [Gammaproteobacteria bacterium]|nr:holo-ACP synthase [Gammaproteobacteria bacterium]
MIYGIGVDVVEIQRFNRIKNRFGDRFVQRLLTEKEMAQYDLRHQSIQFVATRFAAKEAASKALGTGIAKGLSFKSIEVYNDQQGKPQLQFYDAALEIVEKQQISQAFLSLSDEKHYAVAMVVLEVS